CQMGCLSISSGCDKLTEYLALQGHNDDDHDRFIDWKLVCFDVHGVERGGKCLDRVGADHGTHQAELTAPKEIAAQRYCQDRIHLQVQSHVVGIRGIDTAGCYDAGDTCQHAADHIG